MTCFYLKASNGPFSYMITISLIVLPKRLLEKALLTVCGNFPEQPFHWRGQEAILRISTSDGEQSKEYDSGEKLTRFDHHGKRD